jgi:hypothetical protein
MTIVYPARQVCPAAARASRVKRAMKIPNLRLYETQATASVWLSILSLICVVGLTYCVFKGFNSTYQSIPYNAEAGYGRFRPYLVYGGAAATFLSGFLAGVLGFSSLGQKRNPKQGRSWIGMLIGALAMSIAPILFFVWREFSEQAILAS